MIFVSLADPAGYKPLMDYVHDPSDADYTLSLVAIKNPFSARGKKNLAEASTSSTSVKMTHKLKLDYHYQIQSQL